MVVSLAPLLCGLCLGLSVAEASSATANVFGRLLSPQHHILISARLHLTDLAAGRRNVRNGEIDCLKLEKGPPRFKYAFPVVSADDSLAPEIGSVNCSDHEPVAQSIIERLDFSPKALKSSLCEGTTQLLRHFTSGFSDVIETKCTQVPSDGSPGMLVMLEGAVDGEPVAASLRFSPVDTKVTEENDEPPVPPDDPARLTSAETEKARRSRRSENSIPDDLQDCIVEGFQLANPGEKIGDVILVLGTTGVGKSTLVQFVTDHDADLVAKESPADSGNFLIDDGGNKIGSAVGSKTKLPELISDIHSQSKLYDFPGFGDTRGPCSDIVTAAVLRNVALSARSVKIVFVIADHSMRTGSDRLGFVTLLRHATTFMRDPDRYKDSVALVVTKVPNTPRRINGRMQRMPDSQVREGVAAFLRQVRKSLVELKATGSDPPEFYPAADALVRALLHRDEDDQDYTRIGLFRQPEEEGPLSGMETLQEAKKELQAMIYRTLSPLEPEDDDFGLALSPAASVQIERLSGGFAGRLQDQVERIASELKMHFQAVRHRALDVEAVRDLTERDAEGFSRALDGILAEREASDRTPRAFLRCLLDAVRDVHQGLPAEGFLASLNEASMMEFLQSVADDESVYKPDEWAQPLQQLSRYLRGVQLWYALLDDVEKALSVPAVQRDRDSFRMKVGMRPRTARAANGTEYVVARTLASSGPDSKRGMQQLRTVLQALKIHEDKEDMLKKVEVDDAMVRDLRSVLHATLQPEALVVDCNERDLERSFTGRFVWMSEVKQVMYTQCPKLIRAVHIVAQHTLFVDTDFHLHEFPDTVNEPAVLTIVAPRWHVQGIRTISVDGTNGESWTPLPAFTGRDGRAGMPGHPAGSILAVGAEFLDGHLLTLRASGGHGGPGQDGSPGHPGRDGTNATMTSGAGSSSRSGWGLAPLLGSKKETEGGWTAAEGQDGGKGGAGGKGGPAGSVLLIQTSSVSNTSSTAVRRVINEGTKGSDGTGGRGGKGGVHGTDVEHEKSYALFIKYKDHVTAVTAKGAAEAGKDGEDGAGMIGLDDDPQEAARLICPQRQINRARRLSVSALWDRATAGSARRLLRDLDALVVPAATNDVTHPEKCGVTSVLNEYVDLEEARWNQNGLGVAERLLPRYESLLARLDDLLESTYSDFKQVLHTVRAAALTSRRSLRSPARSQLVVDVKGFLETSDRAVRELAEVRKQGAIGASLEEVRRAIEHKTRERQRLLAQHLQPAIVAAAQQLQGAISSLPAELKGEARQVGGSLKAVEHHHRRIREGKFRAQVLGIISKVWRVASSLFMGGGAEIVELAAPEIISEVSAGIDHVKRFVENTREVVDVLNEDHQEGDVKGLITRVAKVVDIVDDQWTDMKNIGKDDRDQPAPADTDENADGSNELEMRSEAVMSRQASPESIPRSAKMRPESVADGQLAASTEAMLASLSVREADLKHREVWLKTAERSIETTITPLLDDFASDINVMQARRGAHRVAAARALQRRLREIRVTLSPLSAPSGGLAVPREIALCAELLDESLGALVSTMDQLDELRERYEMAASLARVASVLTSSAASLDEVLGVMHDPELNADLVRLQEAVRGNLVLDRYNVALHSFKQWVFPFADEYLSNHTSSASITSHKDAVHRASAGLQQLLKEMEEYHTKVVKHDANIREQDFHEPSALYSWSPEEHSEQLDQLLDGKEVAFMADVSRSRVSDDAVKFDTIGVRLVLDNATRQAELNQLLEPLEVTMTHMGDSYYKCGSKVFVISLESQQIDYSVARKPDGSPVMTNNVYAKLRKGDMMLSPFALWKVKLSAMDADLLAKLESFKGDVRLVLEGHAQYVSGFQCSEALEKFYTFEPSKLQLNTLII